MKICSDEQLEQDLAQIEMLNRKGLLVLLCWPDGHLTSKDSTDRLRRRARLQVISGETVLAHMPEFKFSEHYR